jgi:hypothetical protein
MTPDTEAMVRAGYDAYNRRDLDAAFAMLHPSLEWWPAADEAIYKEVNLDDPATVRDELRAWIRDDLRIGAVTG